MQKVKLIGVKKKKRRKKGSR